MHLYEVFVKINGETHYLWRAIDHEGEVLEAFVSKRRDRKAALVFLKKIMKRYGRPRAIVTDRLRSYRAAMKLIGNNQIREVGRWMSNRVRIIISRFDDENTRCYALDTCEVCRNSSQFTLRFSTTSTRNGI